MRLRTTEVLLLLIFSVSLEAQILKNGSMEGFPGTRVPPGWSSCLNSSTADIQPGIFEVSQSPVDGASYLGLVCTGGDITQPVRCEEVNQTLEAPLEAGKCYKLEMYLSLPNKFYAPVFQNPIDMRVSLGESSCTKDQEIVYYKGIDHFDWQRYVTFFSPTEDMNSISLETVYSPDNLRFGYLLIDAVKVEELAQPEPASILICEGESKILNAYLGQDASNTRWSTGVTGTRIEVSEAGTYTATIDIGSCSFEQTFEVMVQNAPVPEFTEASTICIGQELVLDATIPDATYLWDNGATLPTRKINTPGNYSVQIISMNCVSSHTITLAEGSCPVSLSMPNAFSPNADGKNDFFTPIDQEYISSMQTVVYNRWGKVIFSSTDPLILWDGNLPNGQPAPAATYFWSVTYYDLAGNKSSQKGNITILQ